MVSTWLGCALGAVRTDMADLPRPPRLLPRLLLTIGLLLHVEESEHMAAGFDGLAQSLSACATSTQGNGEQLACVTAQVPCTK